MIYVSCFLTQERDNSLAYSTLSFSSVVAFINKMQQAFSLLVSFELKQKKVVNCHKSNQINKLKKNKQTDNK